MTQVYRREGNTEVDAVRWDIILFGGVLRVLSDHDGRWWMSSPVVAVDGRAYDPRTLHRSARDGTRLLVESGKTYTLRGDRYDRWDLSTTSIFELFQPPSRPWWRRLFACAPEHPHGP